VREMAVPMAKFVRIGVTRPGVWQMSKVTFLSAIVYLKLCWNRNACMFLKIGERNRIVLHAV